MNVRPMADAAARGAVNMFFPKLNKTSGALDLIGTAGTIGLQLVSCTVVGLAMGYFLDKWLGTAPWCFFIFLLAGIGVGFRDVFREVRRIERRSERQNGPKGPGE